MRVELINPRGRFALDEQTGACKLCWDTGWMLISYCPHCGAPAPTRNPVPLYDPIPDAERERLGQLLSGIVLIDDAIGRFGAPDETTSQQTFHPEQDGEAPRVFKPQQVLLYTRLSEAAEVWLTERIDGKITWELRGKLLENQRVPQSQNNALHAEPRWWHFWSR